MGSCGFRRCFYENLQHWRWAPVWALEGSSDVFMRIYSILCGLRLFSGWVPAVFPGNSQHFCLAPAWASAVSMKICMHLVQSSIVTVPLLHCTLCSVKVPLSSREVCISEVPCRHCGVSTSNLPL